MITSFISCGRFHIFSPGSHITVDYLLKRDGYVIPDSLYSFFPSDSNMLKEMECQMISQNASKDLDVCFDGFTPFSIIELWKVKDTSFQCKLMDKYMSEELSVVDAGDTSYNTLMVHYMLWHKFPEKSVSDVYYQHANDPVVPYFDDVKIYCGMGCSSTKCELIPGTKIITLLSGGDCLLEPSLRTEEPRLPQEIRHGYRSGVAAHPDSCYILYWTIAW